MTSFDRSAFATRWLVGAAILGGVELASVVGAGWAELLTGSERWLAAFGVACAVLGTLGVLEAWSVVFDQLLGRLEERRSTRVRHATVFLFAAAVSAPLWWDLTSGRRVRELAIRPLLVVAATAVIAAAWAFANDRARRRPSSGLTAFFALVVVAAEVADQRVLPRLYPAFHALLALVAGGAALLAGRAFPRRIVLGERGERLVPLAVTVAFLAGSLAVGRVARAPIGSFVVERRASVTGEFVHGMTRALGPDDDEAAPAVDAPSARDDRATERPPGVDLRDANVLLVTIDALRADRLRAYGGTGLTPNLDALAAEGVVFERAYTSTPHTSYALASLLTGKYLRPVLELPDAPREHTALPERLRRYGYRTAAFYPPAIFFVDAERFRALEEGGFGFEYRKQMFAPADERVRQLEAYLADAPADRSVFAWVHLFEPHEPYDPPPAFRRGEGDEAAYDGEVAAADAAVGALVRSFRARRPGATVIVTADHGEEFGDHGGRYHGSTLYDEQVRVPLIWSSPGVVRPRVVRAPVEHVDLATTLLAALGVPRDVRMRGDDLGPWLAGHDLDEPTLAFADIADQRMVVDGRFKAICESESARCELYDLRADPRERRNLAASHAGELARLRAELSRFVASIPRSEAMAMSDAAAWPEALARAELGDRTVAPELEPLLSSGRSEVRAAAARALAKLGHAPALRALETLAESDPVGLVADEAAVAAVALGSDRWLARVQGVAADVDGEISLRAALALASRGDASGASRLAACVGDAELDEVRRSTCVTGLARVRARSGVPALVAALDDVRLRDEAAAALEAIGDRAAAPALAAALDEERYVPPRLAMVSALAALGDRRFEAYARRYLGMASGMPGGVGLLLDRGRIRGVSTSAGDLRSATLAGFACDASGCRPTPSSWLSFGAGATERRVVVRVAADEGATLVIGDFRSAPLPPGVSEVSFVCRGTACDANAVSARGRVALVAYVVVPSVPEIPPPAPEPWDGGVPDAAIAPRP